MSTSKTALILGVANHRSIAWDCVKSFLRGNDFEKVIFTYQSERFEPTIRKLLVELNDSRVSSIQCDIQTDLPVLFSEQIPEVVGSSKIDAVVHSIAYANFEKVSFSQASKQAFLQAQEISAYSFLDLANHALVHLNNHASLTALTYLGAVRAVPNYHIMGPAKASLEAIVRGLALEYGPRHGIRVNAVSAGPLNTLAARGIPDFTKLSKSSVGPLGPVSVEQVSETVRFLATHGTGITGQTIFVDGGYSSVVVS